MNGIPEADIFMNLVEQSLDHIMEHEMKDAAVAAIQRNVEMRVYAEYEPKVYNRKMYENGLLDPSNMESEYDRVTKTLTVEDVRTDWEPTSPTNPGRKVAPVVESGSGYDFRRIKPRPFHKFAEADLDDGLADAILTLAMEQNVGGWSM